MSHRGPALFLACLLAFPAGLRAWGDSGHEAVTAAALKLLQGRRRALAQFLAPNAETLRRLAVTPDADWKDDFPEEPALHWFEVDAFIAAEKDPDAVMLLPMGEYLDAYPQYRGLLAANADYVKSLAPGRALDPAANGTAPWRVLQLYDQAVAAMKRRDRPQALLYLGVLSHYVADLAQPLHTTVAFDGQGGAAPAAGVHAAFEAAMLDREARRGGLDKPVQDAAAAALGGRGLSALPRDKALRELFALARSGYPLARELSEAFARQCAAAREMDPAAAAPACSPSNQAPEVVVSALAGSAVSVRSGRVLSQTTALKAAEQRLGEAAALTARLWLSAYEAGGSPNAGPTAVGFDSLRVREHYPVPDYLPAKALPEVGRAPAARGEGASEPITAAAAVLADKKGFDNKFLCARGVASVLFTKVSRKGNPYYTFWLNEGGSRLKVHSFGAPGFAEGEEVEACGKFTVEKHVSGRVFYDELSAQVILKGEAMGAGYVELTPSGVLPVKH